jgi:4-amino-4-deoxy-L-arabinose transferase-like glycosyltransferase
MKMPNSASRTKDPQAAIDYYVEQGNFKKDTTWKWQPWGLFAIAAASIKLLGQTTLAARLPFALAGLATVPLLFYLVRKQFGSFQAAALAAVLLICNSYWILHARQCRYYSVSSLFLVLSLIAYARWQWGGRSAAAFIVTAWCWFQVDYGTVLPVVAVLFLEALVADTRAFWRTVTAGAILAATLAPFVWFYDLLHRGSDADGSWGERARHNLFNTNEYVIPVLVVLAVVYVLGAKLEIAARARAPHWCPWGAPSSRPSPFGFPP